MRLRAALLPLAVLAALILPPSELSAASPRHADARPRAESHAAARPLPAGRIKSALSDYDRWLDTLDRRDDVSGLATAVIVDHRVLYERTMGYADSRGEELVRPNTVFRLASLSKAFAAAMTGLLVERGRLDWDSRLVDLLPFFKLKDSGASAEATVGDILGQRLGLPRNTFDLKLEDDVPYQTLVRELDQVDMACGVGECYGYQNVAFSLVGDVIYARTGDFYDHEVERNLFLPLGMTTATYGLEALEQSRSWARPHRRTRAGWVPFEPKPNYYRVAPAAGVNASLRDMEQWLMAQMGDRPDVLPADLLKKLHAPGVETRSELHASPWRRARLQDAHYALGWRVYDYQGETLIFHAGAVQGYRAMIGFFPRYHVGAVIMWNCASVRPAGLMPMLFDRLLGLQHVDWAGLEHPPRSHRRRRH